MRPFLSIATATLLSCLLCFANPAQAETKADSAGIINAAQRIMDMQGRQRQEKSRRIFEEGMKTGNSLITVYGSALLGFHYLLETDPDSALFYLNNAVNTAEKDSKYPSHKEEYDYIVSISYNSLALYYLNFSLDYYKASEYLMDALKHCDKDLDGTIYPLILANLTLVDYYQADSTGMEYARMLKDWSEDRGSYRFHADYAIALMYLTRCDYRMARQHILNAIEYLEDTNEGKYDRELILAYNILGKIYLKTGERHKALEVLQKASFLSSLGTESDITDTYLTLGKYYMEEKDYDRALQTMLKGISLCNSHSIDVHYNELLESISQIYALKNDYRSALDYYILYHEHQTSLFNRNKEYALGEIRAEFNLEQYQNRLNEQEIAIMKRNRLLTLLTFAIVIIVSAAGAIWYFYHKKNKYYSMIVARYKEQVSLNRQIRELEERNPDKYHTSSLSEDKGNDLWKRVTRCMEDEHVYRDSDLTIDKLAARLSTNRSYLSRVINEYAGTNFNQYLNKYRIEEAIRSITESNGECLLKTLAFDLGFKSTSSFNKAFSKETGIPPSAFRDKCRN